MVPGIHDKGTLGQQFRADVGITANAAVQGINSGSQLCRRERLGNIVVSTGHKAGNLVHFLGAGSQHNDAQLLVGGTDLPANFKTVHIAGNHDIQDHNAYIRIVCNGIQGLLTGSGFNDIIACTLQIDHHKAADIQFIFHNQNFFHVSTSHVSPVCQS